MNTEKIKLVQTIIGKIQVDDLPENFAEKNIRFTVSFDGEDFAFEAESVRKGADYVQAVNAAIPWRGIALSLLSEVAPNHRIKKVRDTIEGINNGVTMYDETESEEVEDSLHAILKTVNRACKGKVTVKGAKIAKG